MYSHVTTVEAKQQGLPGSDSYTKSHVFYKDELNRAAGVVFLNSEAHKAFSDTMTIAYREKIASEGAALRKHLEQGGIAAGIPVPRSDVALAYLNWINLEYLKIAAAFELHLKSRLLARDFIIHVIDKSKASYRVLATEQKVRPIGKHELIAVDSYRFNGARNYLPGIGEASIKFSWLTRISAYRAVLELPDEQLDIIDDYRTLRNQIHLPDEPPESKHIRAYPRPIIELLIEFINTEIVASSNDLIKKHGLGCPPLTSLV